MPFSLLHGFILVCLIDTVWWQVLASWLLHHFVVIACIHPSVLRTWGKLWVCYIWMFSFSFLKQVLTPLLISPGSLKGTWEKWLVIEFQLDLGTTPYILLWNSTAIRDRWWKNSGLIEPGSSSFLRSLKSSNTDLWVHEK